MPDEEEDEFDGAAVDRGWRELSRGGERPTMWYGVREKDEVGEELEWMRAPWELVEGRREWRV